MYDCQVHMYIGAKMGIGNRLKDFRISQNLSQAQLAKILKISAKAYWNYENGERDIPSDILTNLVRLYRINLNWIFGESENMFFDKDNIYDIGTKIQNESFYNIPVRGEVSASCGYGIEVIEETQTATFAMSSKFIRDIGINPKYSELIFARGDSMEPTIFGGDSLLIDLSRKSIYEGSIFCIRLNGQIYSKRLQQLSNSVLNIISDNPKYENRKIDLKDESIDFEIIGEVCWWGRVAK